MNEEEECVTLRVDLQCGECGAMSHQGESEIVCGPGPAREKDPAESAGYGGPSAQFKYCSCCGAGYHRYCVGCSKTVKMFFEEWWPSDDECVRTYAPAKRCPSCNAGLGAAPRAESKNDSKYQH